MSAPPTQKVDECYTCKNAGFPGEKVILVSKDQATGKWIMKNENGTPHEHKKRQGGQRGPRYRVAELIEANGVKEANALLVGNKMIDYMGHYYDAVSNKVVYVLAKKEAVN